MNDATQTARTECRRCKGEGMGQHSRANGMCYLCGRMPGEGHAVKVVAPADARARAIADLKVMLGNATGARDGGDLDWWLNNMDGADRSALQTIRGIVGAAPVDVASRARAAFSRIGVTV